MVKVELSKIGGFQTLNIRGKRLRHDSPIELSVAQALMRNSDKNLKFTYEESDRKELMDLDPEFFPAISRELGSKIETHKQLAEMLLPPKPKAKRASTAKAKKSSLTKE